MLKKPFTFRPAFSMLELIFVIIILGIVSGIGAEVIAKVYENYIVQRALHKSSVKTELVAAQIANRLAYAIPNTVIARQDPTIANTFEAINSAPAKTYNIMQWIGFDADSFGASTGSNNPGWNGFCDVDDTANTDTNKISTPGSDLELANTIITNLSNSNKKLGNAAVLYPATYDVHSVGYTEGTRNMLISPILDTTATGAGTTVITFDAVAVDTRDIKEHYKLAWTAYAIVPTEITGTELTDRGFDAGDTIYDLALHHNFQPWDGTFYNSAATVKTTLIRNVSVFNFMGTGDTIRFKLCTQENIGGTYPITMCKEKAVIR